MAKPEETDQHVDIPTTSLEDFLNRLDKRAETIVSQDVADQIASHAHHAVAERLAEQRRSGMNPFKPASSIAEQRAIAANRLPGIMI